MRTSCDGNCNFRVDRLGNKYCTRCGEDRKSHQSSIITPIYFICLLFASPFLFLLYNATVDGLQYRNTTNTEQSIYR